MKSLLLLAPIVAALSGCAALLPDSVGPEVQHTSHITQHQPFTNDPTNIGYQSVAVAAHWHYEGAYVDVSEGYNFTSKEGQVCAGMCGTREVFQARVGYAFKLKD